MPGGKLPSLQTCAPCKFVYDESVPSDHGERPGLRESKKRATRAALSRAALRLAIAHGFDRLTVEDIAAEAGVAPRTFHNYFASKEAAIVAEGTDRAVRFRDGLRARPADEPMWTAMRQAAGDLFAAAGEPDREWVSRARLIKETPALRVEQLKSDTAVQRLLAEEVARRTGTDERRDLYPRLVATAVVGAVRAALDHWLDADSGATLVSLVDRALAQLADGLPAPGGIDNDRRSRR